MAATTKTVAHHHHHHRHRRRYHYEYCPTSTSTATTPTTPTITTTTTRANTDSKKDGYAVDMTMLVQAVPPSDILPGLTLPLSTFEAPFLDAVLRVCRVPVVLFKSRKEGSICGKAP